MQWKKLYKQPKEGPVGGWVSSTETPSDDTRDMDTSVAVIL